MAVLTTSSCVKNTFTSPVGTSRHPASSTLLTDAFTSNTHHTTPDYPPHHSVTPSIASSPHKPNGPTTTPQTGFLSLRFFIQQQLRFLRVADSDNTPDIHLHDKATSSTFHLLKASHRRLISHQQYQQARLGLADYRTPAKFWIIGLKRKLRVPLLPALLRVHCGGIIDIHGDTLFSSYCLGRSFPDFCHQARQGFP
jgi:hypothetical protein